MKNILILILIIILSSIPAHAKHSRPERYYQQQWCSRWHGQMEYKLKDSTRVDCLTKNYAVEFDFAPKWAESIGQSLYYAKLTGKKPAIILIMEKPSDYRYFNRAKALANDYGIKLWTMKSPDYDPNLTSSNNDGYIDISFTQAKKQIKGYLKALGWI